VRLLLCVWPVRRRQNRDPGPEIVGERLGLHFRSFVIVFEAGDSRLSFHYNAHRSRRHVICSSNITFSIIPNQRLNNLDVVLDTRQWHSENGVTLRLNIGLRLHAALSLHHYEIRTRRNMLQIRQLSALSWKNIICYLTLASPCIIIWFK